MSDFVHLHVHSEYSLLDGFSKVSKLVKRAKEMDMPAIALTDHGAMYGVIDFFQAAKKAGIKPIIGMEGYLSARSMREKDSQFDKRSSHLLLLAENQIGYQNLLKIASAAQLEGFYYFPRIDHDFLAAHSEGLIATSGCMSAEIPRAILQDNLDDARKKLDWYYDVFGKDNFFLELQSHDIQEIPALNKSLIELGNRYEGRFVATNDVHYADQQDAKLQDIMLCIQTGSLVSDANRMRMTGDSFYLRPSEEMAALFSDVPGALSNTVQIAERCNIDLTPDGYHLPEFEVPDGSTTQSYLRELCEEGLIKRYGSSSQDAEIRERLEYELGIIHKMGFDAYFLIVWDLCQYSEKQGIWYNARGSAAGSIVAYCLEITLVDPIEHRLLFERFLNPDRISMPDIDLDFQDDKRYKIMEYCAQRYGEDKVASIITFGTMKARAALRDVARVLDIPLNEVDKLAKMIPNVPGNGMNLAEAVKQVPELKQEYDSKSYVRELIDTAKEMEGVIRNAGTHAAGVIITDVPVVDYIPLNRPTNNNEDTPIKTVTQFDMSTVDHLGLLKVDFLGLATLTIMSRACKLIEERHDKKYDLNNIPLDDAKTYEMLGRGETAGVFQFEGAGMRRWMMEMKPQTLDNAVAMVALFRPGPMEFIPTYINRMHGKEEIEYRHPSLEPLFKETYGIAIYQEQLMLAAMQLAGYTGAEADDLRKAISKKLGDKIEKHREKFTAGAAANGMPKQTASDIFKDWENFARYGFNKSHAADYGLIAVQTAFLKSTYPVEYMTAVLSVSQNDIDKIAYYAADCRRMGIELLPPDVNKSRWSFTIEDVEGETSAIRFGLGAIKNVGKGPVNTIIQARGDEPFSNHEDFARRVDLRQVGKRSLECLIQVGALDEFGPRTSLMMIMGQISSLSSTHFLAAEKGQISFFGGDSGLEEKIIMPKPGTRDNDREHLDWERELVGLYISDHPLNPVKEQLDALVTHHSSELTLTIDQEKVRVAGMVTRLRRHLTKKGDQMAFAGLADTEGEIDLVIFPRAWAKAAQQLMLDNIVVVDGKMDTDGTEPKVLVNKIWFDLDKVPKFKGGKKPNGNPNLGKPKNGKPKTPKVIDSKPAKTQISEEPNSYEFDADMPPPPETFPDEWAGDQGSIDENQEELLIDDIPADYDTPTPNDLPKPETSEIREDNLEVVEVANGNGNGNGLANNHPEATLIKDASESLPNQKSEAIEMPKPILSPQLSNKEAPFPSKIITIQIEGSGDNARDILLIRRIYGMLISYPGNDRFTFHVTESKNDHLLEFPNETTGLNEELQTRLFDLVGNDMVRIEEIDIR